MENHGPFMINYAGGIELLHLTILVSVYQLTNPTLLISDSYHRFAIINSIIVKFDIIKRAFWEFLYSENWTIHSKVMQNNINIVINFLLS